MELQIKINNNDDNNSAYVKRMVNQASFLKAGIIKRNTKIKSYPVWEIKKRKLFMMT